MRFSLRTLLIALTCTALNAGVAKWVGYQGFLELAFSALLVRSVSERLCIIDNEVRDSALAGNMSPPDTDDDKPE